MKSSLWLMIAAVALALLAGKEASAQGCSVSYDPSFSLWENEFADSTNIYTQVGIDGSGTMTVEGMCDLPYITHTAYIWNSVGSVGNSWVPVGDYCPDCYVSTEQDDILPYDPNQEYTFDFEGQMWCNIGGEFFDIGGVLDLELAYTKSETIASQPMTGGNEICLLSQWCTPQTQPPDCNPSNVIQHPIILGGIASCSPYYSSFWLAERVKLPYLPRTPWICEPVVLEQNAVGTDDPSYGNCTSNP